MFMNFITLAVEEFYNQASKMRWMFGGQVKVPMVVRAMTAGGFGAGPHHSSSLEAWFASMPGMKVVMPSNSYTAKGLMKAAIRDDNPVLYVEPLSSYKLKMEIPTDDYICPIGKAMVTREGKDVTIVSIGRMLLEATKAADKLKADGIEAEVIDLLTREPHRHGNHLRIGQEDQPLRDHSRGQRRSWAWAQKLLPTCRRICLTGLTHRLPALRLPLRTSLSSPSLRSTICPMPTSWSRR